MHTLFVDMLGMETDIFFPAGENEEKEGFW